jgi:hypothetical protein
MILIFQIMMTISVKTGLKPFSPNGIKPKVVTLKAKSKDKALGIFRVHKLYFSTLKKKGGENGQRIESQIENSSFIVRSC